MDNVGSYNQDYKKVGRLWKKVGEGLVNWIWCGYWENGLNGRSMESGISI
jgi:hypothetical protein